MEAELKRRLPDDTLVPWRLRDAAGDDELPTEPVSDRSARLLLAAILAELQAGGGGTVELGAATLAALETINALVSFPADFPDMATLAKAEAIRVLLAAGIGVTGPLTDGQLRASPVPARDDYQDGEVLADQSGAGAVLTFTFASPVHMVVLESVGTDLTSRADPFGDVPSASQGIRLHDQAPVYVPVVTSEVQVFAPAGASVTVVGLRRA